MKNAGQSPAFFVWGEDGPGASWRAASQTRCFLNQSLASFCA